MRGDVCAAQASPSAAPLSFSRGGGGGGGGWVGGVVAVDGAGGEVEFSNSEPGLGWELHSSVSVAVTRGRASAFCAPAKQKKKEKNPNKPHKTKSVELNVSTYTRVCIGEEACLFALLFFLVQFY